MYYLLVYFIYIYIKYNIFVKNIYHCCCINVLNDKNILHLYGIEYQERNLYIIAE